jgi:hypothetical protein
MKINKKKEVNLNIMGEKIDTRKQKDNDGIVFGFFLILSGAIFLLNNFGVVPWIIWNHIIGFWPIFLILGGLKILLGNNLISRIVISIVTVIFLVLIFIYGLYQVNSPLVSQLSPVLVNLFNSFNNIRR